MGTLKKAENDIELSCPLKSTIDSQSKPTASINDLTIKIQNSAQNGISGKPSKYTDYKLPNVNYLKSKIKSECEVLDNNRKVNLASHAKDKPLSSLFGNYDGQCPKVIVEKQVTL